MTIKHNQISVLTTSWSLHLCHSGIIRTITWRSKWASSGGDGWLMFALYYFTTEQAVKVQVGAVSSTSSVWGLLGNSTVNNALWAQSCWRYDCTRLHGDIFCPRLQFIIWNCDTDLRGWFIAERKIAFCFDRRDAIRKGRQRKQNVQPCLRNGWQWRTSQVDSQSVVSLAGFLPPCRCTVWLWAQVWVLQSVMKL